MKHEQLLESIAVSPIATVITNPRRADNPLEVVNPAFSALTGYREAEIIGRNCRFLAGEATEPWITERIREAIRSRHSVLVDILNYRRDGSPFRNGVLVTPLFDDDGELAWCRRRIQRDARVRFGSKADTSLMSALGGKLPLANFPDSP